MRCARARKRVIADPDGELGLLLRRRACGPRPGAARTISALVEAGPRLPGRRRGRTCGGPSRRASGGPSRPRGTRAPASGRPSRSTRSAFSARNSSRSSRPNSNSSRSYWANFRRSFSLRFSRSGCWPSSPGDCQVHSDGSASEGRFSSIASRIGVGELALGLVLGALLGVLEGRRP